MLLQEVTNLQLPWPFQTSRLQKCPCAARVTNALVCQWQPLPQLPSRGKDHFVEVCRLLVSLSCPASLNLFFPP